MLFDILMLCRGFETHSKYSFNCMLFHGKKNTCMNFTFNFGYSLHVVDLASGFETLEHILITMQRHFN